MNIEEIRKIMTREEFIKKYGENVKCPHSFNVGYDMCDGKVIDFKKCTECLKLAVKDIKFKDDYDIKNLLEQINEYKKSLKECTEVKRQYQCQIDELKAKVHSLETPTTTCINDPKSEKEHYKFIAKENVRLKNIIKLMVESL